LVDLAERIKGWEKGSEAGLMQDGGVRVEHEDALTIFIHLATAYHRV
jgi:hypothetical protein